MVAGKILLFFSRNQYSTNTLAFLIKLIQCYPHKHLAPVVQRVDSTIHWVNHYPLDDPVGFKSTYWLTMVIYPVDNAVHPFNNEQLGPDV